MKIMMIKISFQLLKYVRKKELALQDRRITGLYFIKRIWAFWQGQGLTLKSQDE